MLWGKEGVTTLLLLGQVVILLHKIYSLKNLSLKRFTTSLAL